MKRIYFLISALFISLVMIQCSKPSSPIGIVQHVVLSTSNDGSKLNVDNNLNITWEKTDVINVSGGGTGILNYVSGTGTTAVFEGNITITSSDDLIFTAGNEFSFLNQSGNFENIKNIICLKGTSGYKEDGKYNVNMSIPYAILKLNLSEWCKSSGAGKVEIKVGEVNGTTIASLSYVDKDSDNVYVAIPTNGETRDYIFAGNHSYGSYTWTLNQGTYYTSNGRGSGEAIKIKRQFVDLGLKSGLLWATCNMGADLENEIGSYYAWGETTPYKLNNGEWCAKTDHQDPFNTEVGFGWLNYIGVNGYDMDNDWLFPTGGNDTMVPKEHDVARLTYGEEWGIPLQYQLTELFKSLESKEYFNNGRDSIGIILKGNDDYSNARLFIPLTGYYVGKDKMRSDKCIQLLSNRASSNRKTVCLYYNENGTAGGNDDCDRCAGMVIRPVRVIKSK